LTQTRTKCWSWHSRQAASVQVITSFEYAQSGTSIDGVGRAADASTLCVSIFWMTCQALQDWLAVSRHQQNCSCCVLPAQNGIHCQPVCFAGIAGALSAQAGWTPERCSRVLTDLLKEGLAMLDTQAPGGSWLYWFPAIQVAGGTSLAAAAAAAGVGHG
jgi:hypothetical protein